jgi:hypothetical protein
VTEKGDSPSQQHSNAAIPFRWIALMIALLLAGMALFDHFGFLNFFWPVLISLSAIIGSAFFCWNLHHEAWFWTTLSVAALVHVPLTLWLATRPNIHAFIQGKGVFLPALVDALLISAFIRFPDFLRDSIKWFSSEETASTNTERTVTK